MPLKIISLIKIDGQWVDQDDIPPDKVRDIVGAVMMRAGNAIGAEVKVLACPSRPPQQGYTLHSGRPKRRHGSAPNGE